MAVQGTQRPLSRIVVFLLIPLTLFSACAEGPLRNGVPVPTPPPAANPEIDYPLALGNTWVFQATRYQGYPPSQEMTATLVMTETVVDVQNASPYLIAKIHPDRSAEVPVVVSDSRQSELR